MLELVGGLCRRLRVDFASHTPSASPAQRRAEIQRFKSDKKCRVLLSTDTGGPSLSLQNASVVVHCDQPWNPARLEQRMSRVQQQDRAHAVTVLNLVSERTIEQRMLALLANKQALSESVIDRRSDVNLADIKMAGTNSDSFIQLLELLMPPAVLPTAMQSASSAPSRATRNTTRGNLPPTATQPAPHLTTPPEDRPRGFCQAAAEILKNSLVACEERFPARGDASVLLVVVERDADRCRALLEPIERQFFHRRRSRNAARRAVGSNGPRDRRVAATAGGVRGGQSVFAREPGAVPAGGAGVAPVLSPREQTRARAARDQHARRLKMARVLAAEEMTEEARGALTDSIHDLGRALAIEHIQPEPSNALGAVTPPLDAYWPGGEPAVLAMRSFLADENAPLQPAMTALGQPVEAGANRAKEFFAGIKAKIANMSELPFETAAF